MKRFLAMLLTLALVLSMMPATAMHVHAEEQEEVLETIPETEPAASEAVESMYEETSVPTEGMESVTECTDETVAPTEETEPVEETIPTEVTVSDEATNVVASGTCGENLTWTYSGGTLTVSGSGAMDD